MFGLTVFALASLLVGLAPAGWWLITARGVQGIGAAIVAPSSLSLLTVSFAEGRARSRAVALYGATAGIGASLGLVIGGALADWVSWRAGFFMNVPIGAAMILLAPRFIPESTRSRGRPDLVGAGSATLGVGALVYGITHAAQAGWGTASSGHGLSRAAALTAHVHTALSAGTVLLGACLLAVLGLILPAHAGNQRRRQGAPRREPCVATEPAKVMTSA